MKIIIMAEITVILRGCHIVYNWLLHHGDWFKINFDSLIDAIFGGENLASCQAGFKTPPIMVSQPVFEPARPARH